MYYFMMRYHEWSYSMIFKTNLTITDIILAKLDRVIDIFIPVMLIFVLSNKEHANFLFYIKAFLLSLVITLFLVLCAFIIASLLNKRGIGLGKRTIEITTNFLKCTTNAGSTCYKWQKVKKVSQDKYIIYIELSFFNVFTIRRKDFPTKKEFDECFALMQNYHNQASKGDNTTNS